MAFLTRYQEDSSSPKFTSALRDLVVRIVLPAVLVWGIVTGFGFLLVDGPLQGLSRREETVSKDLAAHRTSTWNTLSTYFSDIGNTWSVIAVAVVAALVILAVTRKWWLAVMPLISISIQSSVFVAATLLTDRPRPEVPKLDTAPPTSSYPSGHEGATTSLYFLLLLFCLRIRNRALRTVTVVLAFIPPFLVAFARLYRGMHHVTDVSVGFLLGIICVLLTWNWLRRDDAAQEQTRRVPVGGEPAQMRA